MDIRPVTLEGRYVRLEPLTRQHAAAFCEAGREWNLTPEKVRDGIESALRQQASGSALPFATVERSSGRVVGGTRFLNITPEHRRLEIGSTWIAGPWRRTAINTEAKFLMLEHAFERLGCIRVGFMADALNETSRKAISRLGAREEGTFRSYIVRADGQIHDAVFYSIIESEWPSAKARLQGMMARPDRGDA
ncbi:MAG: GNAT family N-acetyltransferase [Acidobacteriota bacterium]|nr:GNAT family N-acetyltransferase [Acidobacteriota bacterium]